MTDTATINRRIELIALEGIPVIEPGDDIGALIMQSLSDNDIELEQDDVLVMAQKIISKAENRYAYLNQVTPSENAITLAKEVDKDPKLVQLILDESVAVIRSRPGVIIVEHKLGYIHANAGIDRSNIESNDDNPRVLLLPENSDRSAQQLREHLLAATGKNIAIIINDSAGRAWRNGTVGFTIGSAGFSPLVNLVGDDDMFGQTLKVTEVAVADELAAAASFLMGQASEALPVVLIRGAKLSEPDRINEGSESLIRARELDMFR